MRSTLDGLIERGKSFPYWTVLESEFKSMKAEDLAKDARIAELTTEVADLKSKLDFANVMNADQDKTVDELTAEVEKYKNDAERGQWMLRNASWMRYEDFTAMYVELPMDVHLHNYALRQDAIDIARNALKEGL